MYIEECPNIADSFSKNPSYRSDLGYETDRLILITTLPFLIPDMLVLTPAADTVLLPYDLYKVSKAKAWDETE